MTPRQQRARNLANALVLLLHHGDVDDDAVCRTAHRLLAGLTEALPSGDPALVERLRRARLHRTAWAMLGCLAEFVTSPVASVREVAPVIVDRLRRAGAILVLLLALVAGAGCAASPLPGELDQVDARDVVDLHPQLDQKRPQLDQAHTCAFEFQPCDGGAGALECPGGTGHALCCPVCQ